MKTLTSFFTFLFSIVAYGAVPLGFVPYAQLDTNDFGVTVAGHINTRLGVHTPSTPGDTWYLTINGTNINNGGTNFLQSINPTAGFLPVRGANTNFVDSLILQDATGLHVGTNFAGIIDYFGYPALTLGDTGGVNTYLTLYPDGLFLKDHYGNALNLYGQTANIGGLIYGKSIMQLGTMWGKVELADDNPAHTAKFQPTLPMGTSHTTLGSSTNAWEGLYAGSTKMFQFFDVIIDPGVSTNLNFAVDGVTYNIGAGGGSVGGTTINSQDNAIPFRLNAGAFGDSGLLFTNTLDTVVAGDFYLGGGGTNRMFRNGTSLYYDNPNAIHSFGVTNSGSGGMAFMSIDATGDGANFQGGSLNSTWGIFDGSVGLIAYSNSKIDPTANGTIDFGSSSFLFKDTYSKRYFVGTNVLSTNSTTVTLNGVPIGVSTVTYGAVTNALLATGNASDVFHGDGSWSAGGSGGEWTLVAGPPVGYLTPSTNLLIWGTPAPGSPHYSIGQLGNDLTFSAYDGTDTVTLKANSTDGTTGLKIQTDGTYESVDLTDGVDELLVQVDSGISAGGTGIFINSEDVLPFKRTGTDITPRNAGDSLTISGTGTNTTDTGWEANFFVGTNYIKALNATASRVAYIGADQTLTNATSAEIQAELASNTTITQTNLLVDGDSLTSTFAWPTKLHAMANWTDVVTYTNLAATGAITTNALYNFGTKLWPLRVTTNSVVT